MCIRDSFYPCWGDDISNPSKWHGLFYTFSQLFKQYTQCKNITNRMAGCNISQINFLINTGQIITLGWKFCSFRKSTIIKIILEFSQYLCSRFSCEQRIIINPDIICIQEDVYKRQLWGNKITKSQLKKQMIRIWYGLIYYL